MNRQLCCVKRSNVSSQGVAELHATFWRLKDNMSLGVVAETGGQLDPKMQWVQCNKFRRYVVGVHCIM